MIQSEPFWIRTPPSSSLFDRRKARCELARVFCGVRQMLTCLLLTAVLEFDSHDAHPLRKHCPNPLDSRRLTGARMESFPSEITSSFRGVGVHGRIPLESFANAVRKVRVLDDPSARFRSARGVRSTEVRSICRNHSAHGREPQVSDSRDGRRSPRGPDGCWGSFSNVPEIGAPYFVSLQQQR